MDKEFIMWIKNEKYLVDEKTKKLILTYIGEVYYLKENIKDLKDLLDAERIGFRNKIRMLEAEVAAESINKQGFTEALEKI